MLDRVAVQQERFRTPGLRADGRGIAIGERGLLRFGTLTQVVGFFRAFSEEQSLDHILPTLRIIKARSQIQGLEILLELPSQGSHMLDRAAAIARLLRGSVCTGRAPHFVRYRDQEAPFGYDAARLSTVSEGLVLYDQAGPLQFKEEGEISMKGLLLSLTLMRLRREPLSSGPLFIRTPPGLRNAVQRFLWERRIVAGVAELVREASGRFDQATTFYLFRVEQFSARLIPLFEGLPGVELYHARRSNLFVQRGYEHPFALESCRKALEEDGAYFFSGHRDAVDRVAGDAIFVDIEHLKAIDVQDPSLKPEHEAQILTRGGRAPQGWSAQQVSEALHYPVHLIHRQTITEGASAVFINSPQEMGWLKRLVYALPETALESYKMALTDKGCLILNRQGVELVPIGMQLREVFTNVFIPREASFSPPLGHEQLKQHLGLRDGFVVVMPQGLSRAFEVAETALHPLARYLLAEVDLSAAQTRAAAPMAMAEAVELVNRDLGYFALWGHNLRKVDLKSEVGGPTQPMKAVPPPGPPRDGDA